MKSSKLKAQSSKFKHRLLFVVCGLVFSHLSFSQIIFDTIPNKGNKMAGDSVREIFVGDAHIVNDTLKYDTSVLIKPASTKKIKNGRFVWNDRKYKLDSLSTVKVKRHSPLYATLFSLVVPGLGQAYNRKYWKIPIVYAGLGGLGYALYYTTSNFYGYRNAYRLQVDEDPATEGQYKGVSNAAELKSYRDYYKRNVDLCAIFTAVWYGLNLVDAAVDAHLFEWNMKDDIQLSWRPVVMSSPTNSAAVTPGLRLNLNF